LVAGRKECRLSIVEKKRKFLCLESSAGCVGFCVSGREERGGQRFKMKGEGFLMRREGSTSLAF